MRFTILASFPRASQPRSLASDNSPRLLLLLALGPFHLHLAPRVRRCDYGLGVLGYSHVLSRAISGTDISMEAARAVVSAASHCQIVLMICRYNYPISDTTRLVRVVLVSSVHGWKVHRKEPASP
jgi:hypothetical protein